MSSTTKLTALDVCLAVLLAPCLVTLAILRMLLRRLSGQNDLPFKTDVHRSIIRSIYSLPVPVLLKLGSFRGIDDVLQSMRFCKYQSELCEKVHSTKFTGFWICQGSLGRRQPAASCDATLLYIHGGAYVTGHPLSSLVSLLRVSELLATQGTTVSIFALAYPLAHEATFPAQQEHALAAYKYLTGDAGVPASRLIVLGESAGGHLALSLLCGIAASRLATPAGALLLCPWVNLSNTGASFERNKNRDFLTKGLLDRCVKLVDPSPSGEDSTRTHDFTARGFRWKDILPAQTIVSVGTHDVFVDDVVAFKQNVESSGGSIVLKLAQARPHGWELSDDKMFKKQYLETTRDEEMTELLEGARSIFKNLLNILKASGAGSGGL